ncbi:glucokinase [Candidatus Thiothrix sp. Deng01]|uniref:Glucokinase n=1 Tax=Candidatus Thiothrix phosphatis TaxID=3112415 RepID=A0ABU6D297_9GAMM|nr:glucokinase [Candidatus Thiothrix sp. Deng01]MEB4593187.1 glucokinase [Candidatus Thiothrix sp. Deng01]
MTYLLAGDVGGTKTVLGLYLADDGKSGSAPLQAVHKAVYPSSGYALFSDLVSGFLAEVPLHRPAAACFGIAGPIQDQRCDATNLPWVIDAHTLATSFGFSDVCLLNDLEAAAYGMLHLAADEFVELNPHAVSQAGHAAVIAAGTGLGEAILAWDGQRHIVMPTEGGHSDFGPNSSQEDALLLFLRKRFGGHVSGERILAGNGFGNLYDFLRASSHAAPNPEVEAEMLHEDRNAVISRHGLAGSDPLCAETMRLFVRIYGSEAGNLALKCLPRGGIYIGGGIGPKIRAALETGVFMQGFLDKGRMARAIEHIPVRLSLNPEAPLLGAAHMAMSRFRR